MPIQDVIAQVSNHYTSVIKPLLEDQHYKMAGFELETVIRAVIDPNLAEIIKYKSGISFVASARFLEKKLKEGDANGRTQEFFEAMLAQVGMSIKTENMFEEH